MWAPDLRGYNESQRPRERNAYHLTHLVADVAALVRATGQARAHIGGHDWGGLVAWTFAGRRPELVDRLVLFNAPPVGIYLQKVRRPPQMFRSGYVLLFLVPHLGEWTLSVRNYHAVRHMLGRLPARGVRSVRRTSSNMSTHLVVTWRADGSAERLPRQRRARRARGGTQSPHRREETLVIWGDRDPALGKSRASTVSKGSRRGPACTTSRTPGIGSRTKRQPK